MKYVSIALATVAAMAMIGFGIGSIDLMPSYAVVFLDDTNKTFIALPCIDEWRSGPTQTVDLVTHIARADRRAQAHPGEPSQSSPRGHRLQRALHRRRRDHLQARLRARLRGHRLEAPRLVLSARAGPING
jgi:hypothetical protein